MARIHVCPLSRVEAVLAASGASSAISVLALRHRLPDLSRLDDDRWLHLAVSDITEETPNYRLADADHIEALLAFLRRWDGQAPLLIHCYAGVSRSTAAAFIALCLLEPARPERTHADALRRASPTATPNPHLVALADATLGRQGRMIDAVASIGRGADCFEGNCFSLDVDAGAPRAEIG